MSVVSRTAAITCTDHNAAVVDNLFVPGVGRRAAFYLARCVRRGIIRGTLWGYKGELNSDARICIRASFESMDEMKIKGVAPVILRSFVETTFGEEAADSWLGSLSEEQQNVMRYAFASSWYDFRTMYDEPVRSVCRRFYPENQLDGARAVGTFTAEKQLKGVYRILLKLGSPNFMISAASKTWRTMHTAGKLDTLLNEKGSALIRTREMPPFFDVFSCEVTAGWMEKALALAGAREGRVVVRKNKENDDVYFEFVVTWN